MVYTFGEYSVSVSKIPGSLWGSTMHDFHAIVRYKNHEICNSQSRPSEAAALEWATHRIRHHKSELSKLEKVIKDEKI